MRGGLRAVWLVVGMLAGAATAQEVSTSPRPQPRPSATVQQVAPPVQTATTASTVTRPKPRPGSPLSVAPQVAAATSVAMAAPTISPRPRPAAPAIAMSSALPPQPDLAAALPVIRPMPRPASWAGNAPEPQQASAPQAAPERRGGLFGGLFSRRERTEKPTPTDGYVCGDPDIRGDELAPITSSVRGCGIEEPVRVTSVDGIRLTTPATINCTAARALKTWIDEGMRPAFKRPEVVELRIAASYICRPRNNVRGAKISEHGRGNAIDISGFILSNGRELSVASDYNRTIRRAHKAACGIFGTTLGPGSDGYHEDHLHFDVANLNRPYCR